jgi:hypothetical protein
MATTTNYGWTTPDDTALVKDGAAAIRTLGTSVDTTTKNLNPSTTLGDIEYRSSTANTNTRLGIGTTGQVLTVTGGVPAWATISAGGMTLLSTTTLSGASTTISSISGSYKNLYGVAYGYTNATSNNHFIVRPNDVQSGRFNTFSAVGGNATLVNQQTDICLSFQVSGYTILRTDANNAIFFEIKNYASTVAYKPVISGGYYVGAGTDLVGFGGSGGWSNTSAITSLTFYNTGGNFSTGTVLLYGVS